jgi:hypothetical protein
MKKKWFMLEEYLIRRRGWRVAIEGCDYFTSRDATMLA